jgi:hypothetical protein
MVARRRDVARKLHSFRLFRRRDHARADPTDHDRRQPSRPDRSRSTALGETIAADPSSEITPNSVKASPTTVDFHRSSRAGVRGTTAGALASRGKRNCRCERELRGRTDRRTIRGMAIRRFLVLAVLALQLTIGPAPAQAKEDLVVVLVCGADRCAELRGPAVARETSTILLRRFFRRHVPAVPFYDVLFVWRDEAGSLASGGVLRWAPAAGATRTTGARGAVWSRTGAALKKVLAAATRGMRPRPATALEGPPEAVGPATLAARRKILSPPVAKVPSGTAPESPERISTDVLVAVAGIALVAIMTAMAASRRRRMLGRSL